MFRQRWMRRDAEVHSCFNTIDDFSGQESNNEEGYISDLKISEKL